MLVADEIHESQRDERAFGDIEPEVIAGLYGVTHAYLGVAVLPVKQFEKKCRVIAARGSETEIVDRRDLLLQLRAEVLLAESGLPAELDHAGVLRLLLLLLLDGAFCLVLLLRLRDFHRRLAGGASDPKRRAKSYEKR